MMSLSISNNFFINYYYYYGILLVKMNFTDLPSLRLRM